MAASWAIYTIPSMTDGSELPTFIQSGVLSNASANVTVNSNGVAALCFNSVGRLVANAGANVTAVTGGANCVQPTAGVPPVQQFNITTPAPIGRCRSISAWAAKSTCAIPM